jgi:hypothetical protein
MKNKQWCINFIHYGWKWTLIDEYHPLNEKYIMDVKWIHGWNSFLIIQKMVMLVNNANNDANNDAKGCHVWQKLNLAYLPT